MIDESLLSSLNSSEKEAFKKGLQNLIDQTYLVEKEYKKLNESYIALEAFLRQIIETLPDALWVLEDGGNLFLQNSEALEISSLLPKMDLTKNSNEIEHNDATYLVKTVKKGDKTIILATDITGEKRKERLASMGQVAAHLSHEIRNPIGSISLLVSSLYKRVDTSSKPLVLEMKKAIWRVERIIKATLLFSKGIQPQFNSFFLNELANECELALHNYSYTKAITFSLELPKVSIKGDKDLLVLVFQNLLFNAIDAIEESELEDGNISFKYSLANNFHLIDVIDSGKEILNESVLFEPFKTTKTKGNGLGLALSLQIVEAHGGKIELLKEPKGFRVLIP
jgi:signal transduction histidine kinase